MKRDASDNGAAQTSSALKDAARGQGHGQYPWYWPAWLVCGIALTFVAIQYVWLPGTPEIDFSGLFAETLICMIPLAGLFVVQHLRPTPRLYWPLMIGLSFLLLSHSTDAIDEIRAQPALVGILVEDGLAVLGYAILVIGLVRWLRFNQQLLAEIQALNADLEQRVESRTATLEAEIAERRQFEERLRDSEGRYRELNAVLEQRVAERTAEVHAANALLREREERLEFILEGSRLGAWDWHIASGKVERNDYWAAMLGYSRQEVDDATANGWLELIHPDDRPRAWQSIDDHLAGRTALHEMEYRMRTRDGDYRWILDRARIVSRDADGRPLRMSGTHEDITGRKQIQQALEESHQRLTTILNATDAEIYIADMETHEILFMNRPLIQALGPVEGQPCYRALQGLDAPCSFCTNDKLVKADGSPAAIYQWEFQNQLNHRWYDLRDCAVRWTDGRLVRMEIATDVTERKQIELRLRQSEERFRLLATHALDNIWVMGPDYRMRYISPSIQTLTGYTVQEYLDMSLDQWLMPGSLAVAVAYFADLDARRAAGISVADHPFRGEIELGTKDGTGVWTEIIATPLVDAEGRMTELAGVTRDIRERKGYEAELHQAREAAEIANRALLAANTELQRLAATDRLTGIWNRLHFDEAAVIEIERAARYGEPLSLVLFDIDHFKAINDTRGHLVGDQVLVELTQRVRQHLRTGDLLARWGGEEFVVLLPHTRGEDAAKLAEKLRGLIAGEPFPEVGRVTSSFGVAEFRPHETSDLWLTRVDDALYAAKAGGRNRVCLAEPA